MAEYNEFPQIMKRIDRLLTRVREQETAPRLYSAGIGSGGLIVEQGGSVTIADGGDLNILEGGDINISGGGGIYIKSGGSISSDGPATFTGSANITGNTTITGDLTINGNLTLPAGSIDGAMLQNQFSVVRNANVNSNVSYNYNNDFRNVATTTVQVPGWATTASIVAHGAAAGINIATNDYYGRMLIHNLGSQWFSGHVYAVGGSSNRFRVTAGDMERINVSNLSSFNVSMQVRPRVASSGTGNAQVYVTTIFRR